MGNLHGPSDHEEQDSQMSGIIVALLAALTLTSCAGSQAALSTPPPQPNLIVFLVDDLGWQDISLPLDHEPTPFNERYRTPNVERLAAQGMTFTQAYASAPVCTPTRTSLMTGRSPARNHITYWTLNADSDTSAPFAGLLPPAWNVNGLQPDDVTLPALLGQAGYRTIHVGKAHFGAQGTLGSDPINLGFDVNVAGHGAGAPASYLARESFSRGNVWDVPGLESWHGSDAYLTEALSAEALSAVRDAVAAGQPFFLNMAPYAVHTPIMANPRHVDDYPGLPPVEAAYASMIAGVDKALGELLDLLDELDIAGETVVIFTSDNGGLSAHGRAGEPHTHNAPLRSGKGSYYEGGLRVPAVVRWPGVTEAGSRSLVPIITHDLFHTLLAMAGVSLTAKQRWVLDGMDISPLLKGSSTWSEQVSFRTLFWHQPHYWGIPGPGIEPFSAMRWGRFKLIYRHLDRGFELYDLQVDLGERHDLAPSQPELLQQLAGDLKRWLRRSGAQMSIDEESGEPVQWPADALALRDED
ncbi:MAG: arylsulfatase A-like enzyme [Pseudohongiellaceae bacterium]|jgi:arylsulfatase A-like enzyme